MQNLKFSVFFSNYFIVNKKDFLSLDTRTNLDIKFLSIRTPLTSKSVIIKILRQVTVNTKFTVPILLFITFTYFTLFVVMLITVTFYTLVLFLIKKCILGTVCARIVNEIRLLLGA